MEKGATKKKVAAKKPVTKKVTKKKTVAKKMATPEIQKVTKKKTIIEPKKNQIECKYCYHEFGENLTVCPFCRRSQKDKIGLIVIMSLSLILIFCLVANYFVERYYEIENEITDFQYKEIAPLVAYEDMIMNAIDLRGTDVSVYGVVLSVDGIDTGSSNKMTVTMDINRFEGGHPQLVTFAYEDLDFTSGIMPGKEITVFGEYTKLNGSTPHIVARFVEFGN